MAGIESPDQDFFIVLLELDGQLSHFFHHGHELFPRRVVAFEDFCRLWRVHLQSINEFVSIVQGIDSQAGVALEAFDTVHFRVVRVCDNYSDHVIDLVLDDTLGLALLPSALAVDDLDLSVGVKIN